MAYNGKTNWQNNEIVEAADMNRIEQGITDNDTGLGNLDAALTSHNHDASYLEKTATATDSYKLGGQLPSAYAASSHSHAITDVDSLQTTLDGKAASSHAHSIADVSDLQTTLNGKASSSHTHTIANVTNLQTTLDGKAASSHTHTIANVSNLQTTLNGKAASSHTHTIANVTNLQSALDGKEPTLETERKRKITISTANPSGGVNGDIWIKVI